jgi:Transposase DDE domain
LLTTNSRGKTVQVATLFRGIKPTEECVLYGKRMLMGQEVYLSALWLQGGDLLVVATDKNPGFSIKTYGLRWEIESLFSCLKSRGFNFEDTHIIDPNRIKKLFVLLAVAFCWAHKTGEWRHAEVRPIKIKKHGRPAVSIFRYGLDYIIEVLMNPLSKFGPLTNLLGIFVPIKLDSNLTVYHV